MSRRYHLKVIWKFDRMLYSWVYGSRYRIVLGVCVWGVGASQVVLVVKSSSASAGDASLIPVVGKVPWRKAWQPTPVFLPRKSQAQRSMAGYSSWGHKELDTTEVT